MYYRDIFKAIVDVCDDERAYIIIGLLQSIRDENKPDYSILEEMFSYLRKHHPDFLRTENEVEITGYKLN